jgi:hypothetical protein
VSGGTINGVTYNVAARWWGNVSRNEMIEIDVVALSTDKKSILVGECKWNNISDSYALIANLIEKARKIPVVKGKEIVPILFVKDCKTKNNNVLLAEDILILK